MDENIKRPNAALINREWFEAAQQVLPENQLGRVLLNACCYVFGKPEYMMPEATSRAVFAMIKPALDSDIQKYLERCARNAANAKSRSERVVTSGSDSQRVGANTNTTTTPTTTTTTTTTPSLSQAESEERERWLVFGYFWSIGSKAIKEESNAFWSYYESLGWKNNKGAAIVSKLACARMWKHQFETGSAPHGADAWFKAVQDCSILDYSLFTAFVGAERKKDCVIIRLSVGEPWLAAFKEQCGGVLNTLAKLWKAPEIILERVS